MVTGYYGFGNTGDEAILASMLADLRELRSDIQVTVLSGNPEETAATYGVDAIEWRDPLALEEAVRGADLVLIGGGGLFQDYWGFNPDAMLSDSHWGLSFYTAPAALAALHGKPLMLYAVGIGPLLSDHGRQFTKAACEAASTITVRDDGSKRLLESLGVPGARVSVTADPVFGLAPPDPARIRELAEAERLPAERPRVGVALRYWDIGVDPEFWQREVASGLDMFLKSQGGSILFVPFQRLSEERDNDVRVAERVRGWMKRRDQTAILERPCAPAELAGLLAECDLVLGMRLHAGIFAILGGVPLLALSYDPKVSHLTEQLGHPELAIELGQIDAHRMSRTMSETLIRREEYSKAFRQAAEKLRAAAKKNAELASELLEKRPTKRSPLPAEVTVLISHTVRSLTAQIAERQQEVTKLAQALHAAHEREEEQSRRQEKLERELSETREELTRQLKLEEEKRQLQRQALLTERNLLDRELKLFRASAGVRLVLKYRSLLQRFLPEGTRRREIYWKAHRAMRSLLSLDPVSGAPRLVPVPGSRASVSAPDPRGELSRFVESVTDRGAKSAVAILSATKLLESEGQRPTQLALELSRRGIPVVFAYWRWWPDEWCAQDRLDQGIFQIPIDVVLEHPDDLFGAFGQVERLAFFEFPHPSFFEPLAAANAKGWTTIYDVLDDWEEFHRVGQAVWYQEPFERHLIRATDAVFAINEQLADRVRSLGGENAEIVPNGLKPGIEKIDRPRRLERGEVTVGYFGYLAGAWFDWELVASAARARPSWRLYLIGYGGRPEGVVLPENVSLLGKKPQTELASYAANWDVAIIPFKPDRLAAGADPIKTYEYLVMGLPVVVTGVYPPPGGEEFVWRAEGLDDFLAKLARASGERSRRVAERRAYATSCTWPKRVDALMDSVRSGRQRIAEKQRLFAG